ncbi:MAG TPA: ATP-binding protein, partial [Leptospiraceae bacterium]|nr:ATP-binding protein [Leptospiraceae bacterium]
MKDIFILLILTVILFFFQGISAEESKVFYYFTPDRILPVSEMQCRPGFQISSEKDEENAFEWFKIKLPGYWKFSSMPSAKSHICRFHFKAENHQNVRYSINLLNVINSHEIYLNSEKIGGKGSFDTQGNLIQPNPSPALYDIPSHLLKDENVIMLRIVDSASGGGILEMPSFGESGELERKFYLKMIRDGGFAIFFITIAIYHIFIYAVIRKNKELLVFGIIALCGGIGALGYYKLTYVIVPNFYFHFYALHISHQGGFLLFPFFISRLFSLRLNWVSVFMISVHSVNLGILFLTLFSYAVREFFRSYVVMFTVTVMYVALSFLILQTVFSVRKRMTLENKIISVGLVLCAISAFQFVFSFNGIVPVTHFLGESFLVLTLCTSVSIAVKYNAAQEELIQMKSDYNAELEKEVALKSEVLKQTNTDLQRSNMEKERLLTVLAHDLRSPLNLLQDSINVLQYDSLSGRDFKRIIREISLNLKRNKYVLENLLVWSSRKLASDPAVKQRTDISIIVMETVEFFKSDLKKKKIRIDHSFNVPVYCRTDRNTVRLVLRNLISNSIKFSGKKSVIHAGFSMKLKENKVRISVQDQGSGLSKEALKKIEDHFPQNPRPDMENETGFGIGLFLCQEFLEKAGSSLHLNPFTCFMQFQNFGCSDF